MRKSQNKSFNILPYKLSSEQQQILDSQIKLDEKLYTNAESLYTGLKKKHKS